MPAAWLRELCQALLPRLSGCGSQTLVLSLTALGHLRFHPGPHWLAAHEEALRARAAHERLGGRAAARVAASWAALGHTPGRGSLDRLLRALVAASSESDAWGEALRARARVAAQAGPGMASQAGGALPPRAPERVPARLFAEGLHGLAVLKQRRDEGAGSGPQAQPRASAADGANAPASPSAPGNARGPPQPQPQPLLPPVLSRALLRASASRLPHSYLDHALLHLRAWRLLRLAPPHAWRAALAAALLGGGDGAAGGGGGAAKLAAATPAQLAELLSLLAWSGWRQLREPGPDRNGAQVCGSGGGVEGARHVGGLGPGLRVSGVLLHAAVEALWPRLGELDAVALAEVATSLAALRLRLPADRLQALSAELRGRGLAMEARVAGSCGGGQGPSPCACGENLVQAPEEAGTAEGHAARLQGGEDTWAGQARSPMAGRRSGSFVPELAALATRTEL